MRTTAAQPHQSEAFSSRWETSSIAADRSIAPNKGHYPIVRAGGAKAYPAQGAYACWSTARALFRSSVAITIFAGPNVV